MSTLELPEEHRLSIVRDFLQSRLRTMNARAKTLEASTHAHALALELHFVQTVLSTMKEQPRG